jgi:hypothetical protein
VATSLINARSHRNPHCCCRNPMIRRTRSWVAHSSHLLRVETLRPLPVQPDLYIVEPNLGLAVPPE